MERLSLYEIDMKYIRDLHAKDENVPSVSPQIGKEHRAFLGVIVINNGKKYCIPLSHPKAKHSNMKGKVDFTKIEDEKGNMIGALNFNQMIPVEDAQITPIELSFSKNDTPEQHSYKRLCQKEITWIRKHKDDVVNKANVLYNLYMSGENFSAKDRCVNYPVLEQVCEKYNAKSTKILK